MPKNTKHTIQRSLLGRRLRKMMEKPKYLSNPVTWLPVKDKAYFITLTSNDEKVPFMTFTINIARVQIRFLLPKLLKPHKAGVYKSVKGFTRKMWVTKYAPRIYGIGYLPKEKLFHIFYGINSGNLRGFPRDKLFIWSPPWSKFRLTKHSIIGKTNNTFWKNTDLKDTRRQSTMATDIISNFCPKLKFICKDEYDQEVLGSAFIEEKEWSKGIFLYKPLVKKRRVLKVHLQVNNSDTAVEFYNKQCDYVMLPNESLIDAVTRFCEYRSLTKEKPFKLHLEKIDLDVT